MVAVDDILIHASEGRYTGLPLPLLQKVGLLLSKRLT